MAARRGPTLRHGTLQRAPAASRRVRSGTLALRCRATLRGGSCWQSGCLSLRPLLTGTGRRLPVAAGCSMPGPPAGFKLVMPPAASLPTSRGGGALAMAAGSESSQRATVGEKLELETEAVDSESEAETVTETRRGHSEAPAGGSLALPRSPSEVPVPSPSLSLTVLGRVRVRLGHWHGTGTGRLPLAVGRPAGVRWLARECAPYYST